MNYKRFKIVILFSFLFSLKIYAHPHLAIYSSCEFVFEGSDLCGFWVDFQFDRYFTSDMINSYDENKDSLFDDEETKKIYNEAFINLKKYGFFISIRKDQIRVSPEHVENFSAYLEDGLLVYHFYIDYSNREDRELYISIYDPTYFCATYFREDNPVVFSGFSKIQPDFKIAKNKESPIYYDPLAPAGENTSYVQWEPGLQTYYPEEIHLVY